MSSIFCIFVLKISIKKSGGEDGSVLRLSYYILMYGKVYNCKSPQSFRASIKPSGALDGMCEAYDEE